MIFATGCLCSDCAKTGKEAYPGMTPTELDNRLQASSDFKAEFKRARCVKAGSKKFQSRRQFVKSNVRTGIRAIRWYVGLTPMEFQSQTGFTPKELKYPVDNLEDDEGNPIDVVLLTWNGAPTPYRIFEVFHENSGAVLDEFYHMPEGQLRKDQGRDIYLTRKSDEVASRPPRLRKSTKTASLDDAIRAGKAHATAKKEAAAKQAAEALAAAGNGEAAAAAAAADGDEMSDEDGSSMDSRSELIASGDSSAAEDVATLPSAGKGRGRSGRQVSRGRAVSCRVRTSTSCAAAAADTPAATIMEFGALAPAGTPERLISNVRTYIQQIQLSQVLEGVSKNTEIYQAQRTQKALAKIPDKFESEKVELETHLRMTEEAKTLVPDIVHKLSQTDRLAKIRLLQAQGVVFGPLCRAGLICVHAKEQEIKRDLSKFTPWIATITPWDVLKVGGVAGAGFDPTCPALWSSGLSPDDGVKILHRCLLDECLMPMIRAGPVMKGYMIDVCLKIFDTFSMMPEDLPPLMEVVVVELRTIVGFVGSILSPMPFKTVDPLEVSKLAQAPRSVCARTDTVLKAMRLVQEYKAFKG